MNSDGSRSSFKSLQATHKEDTKVGTWTLIGQVRSAFTQMSDKR